MFVNACETFFTGMGAYTQCQPVGYTWPTYSLGSYGIWGHRWHRGWWR